MTKIKLGLDGDSSSVYELIEILKIKGCDGNIIYEIHNQSDIKGHEPFAEFVNRSKRFYDAFINPGLVDNWASENISYAAKIDELWYFAADVGSNTYLGGGPTSILEIREFCFNSSIKILYVEDQFDNWVENLFSSSNSQLSNNQEQRTIPQSYNESNRILKRCGDGIAQIIKTADKLSENNIRDLFLAAFNSHIDYVVVAEATNRQGRTDLKIIDKKLDVTFIYEFKIHKTDADITQGLFQITKQYPTTLDRTNGLIFINKTKQDLSLILSSIQTQIENLELIIEDIYKDSNEHRLVVRHKHPLDKTINCTLTIFLFDIREIV